MLSNEQFRLNTDVNWQVKFFLETIMGNFIPNHIKKCVPRGTCDPPWIHKSLKTMLKKKKTSPITLKAFVLNTSDRELIRVL